MRLFNCRADVRCTQHGENESLQKSDQQLQGHHEQRERYGGRYTHDGAAGAFARFAENKNQAHKGQNYDVAGCYVGKKTKKQRKWLEEESENLDRGQDKDFQDSGNAWHPECMFPEMFIGAEG